MTVYSLKELHVKNIERDQFLCLGANSSVHERGSLWVRGATANLTPFTSTTPTGAESIFVLNEKIEFASSAVAIKADFIVSGVVSASFLADAPLSLDVFAKIGTTTFTVYDLLRKNLILAQSFDCI